jgi:hypothetical protein
MYGQVPRKEGRSTKDYQNLHGWVKMRDRSVAQAATNAPKGEITLLQGKAFGERAGRTKETG